MKSSGRALWDGGQNSGSYVHWEAHRVVSTPVLQEVLRLYGLFPCNPDEGKKKAVFLVHTGIQFRKILCVNFTKCLLNTK